MTVHHDIVCYSLHPAEPCWLVGGMHWHARASLQHLQCIEHVLNHKSQALTCAHRLQEALDEGVFAGIRQCWSGEVQEGPKAARSDVVQHDVVCRAVHRESLQCFTYGVFITACAVCEWKDMLQL
jgi:hypothetical protein